jgi:ribosomal protein L24E
VNGPAAEKCTWCGASVEHADGFRAYEAAGERRAVFCRLEHIVPWSIQGPHWEAGTVNEPARIDAGQLTCSFCGKELDEVHVLLVRHRGEHRVADDFCSTDHMAEWAKSGGRWQ